MHRRTSITVLAVLALAISAPSGGWAANSLLGQTVSSDLRLDGAIVPSGTTLLSPSEISAGDRPGFVRLQDSRVIGLGEGSTAYLAAVPGGGMQLEVRSGIVSVEQPNGELMKLASNSMLVLNQEGRIQEGESITMVALCTYSSARQEWDLVEVAEPEVEARLAAGDVYPGTEGLDEECDDDDVPVIFWTTGKKWAAGVGIAAVLGWGIDELQDDDTVSTPASPVVP